MAVTQSLTLTQSSQSTVSNYSTVRVVWKSTQSDASYNSYTRTAYYYVSKNGGAEEKYSVSYTLPKNSTKTILDTTITVPHKADGTGSVKVRTSMDTNISAGVITQEKTLALTTIPRQSTLTVNDGTLGEEQSLVVVRQADSFTHSITWKCGDQSGTICSKSKDSIVKWTPSLELGNQAPSASSVSVVFTITTYSGSTAIGSNTRTASYDIPEDLTPYFAISTSDPTENEQAFMAYVQGKSKLKIVIQAYGVYGSWITSYKTDFEGLSYTESTVTTNTIKGSGQLTATITVTDSRGRTASTTKTITVIDYSPPKITSLSAYRCDSRGNASSSGEYLKVNYSDETADLNGHNPVTYYVKYRKTGETNYTTQDEGTFIFKADTNSSYDIVLSITDWFCTVEKATAGPSVKKLWSLLKKYGQIVGGAIGKVAELEGTLDIAWKTKFSGGVLHPVLADKTDLNTLLLPQTFMLPSANSYTNAPETGVTAGAFLEIVGTETESLIMRYHIFHRSNPRVWERIHYQSSGWGDWRCVRGDFVVEEGASNGWTYRKWNSGVAECWKIHEFSTTINTAFGSLYCGNAAARVDYPFSFTEKPVETVTLQSGATQAILYCEASGYGVNGVSSSARYNVFRPGAMATAQTFYLSFHVIGKWK